MNDTQRPHDFAQAIHTIPHRRRALLFRVRRQIAEGTYDTNAKLDAALDRLFQTLEREDDNSPASW